MEQLQDINRKQSEIISAQARTIEELRGTIVELNASLAWLKRKVFGKMSEKCKPVDNGDPKLPFDYGDLERIEAEIEEARSRAAPGTTGGETRRLLERRWDNEGGEALFAELRSIDPESAAVLHPNDKKRVIRALEVYRETGKTMSRHNADTRLVPPRYEPVYLGLAYADREEMKRIIDLRVDRMVAQGLFDEVRALVESGVPRTATAMQAIGYKECLGCLAGECTQDEAVAEIKLRSRQYAKRQLTWLRRNRDIHWFYRKNSRDLPAALQFSTEILTNLGVS